MKSFLALAFLILASSGAAAQHNHATHSAAALPEEVGQSAFAALAEIVAILRSDPETDWDSVDIPALQEHLVDMEVLATETTSEAAAVENGVRFTVGGTPRGMEALRRMVPAHAPFLDAETGWTSVVEISDSAVVLVVTGDADQIAALGFHGLMTIGAHHQEHHLLIASGRSPHH